jgi:putative transposase
MTAAGRPAPVHRRVEDRWAALRPHIEDGLALTTMAERTGIGLRTLQRWYAAYKQASPAGLAPKTRSDRGIRKVDPQVVALIEGLSLSSPRPSVATITRRIAAMTGEHGWVPVSYGVIRSIVACISPDVVTLAHEGDVAYRDKYELVWRQRADQPNTVWQADHTELDILIRDANGDPARPWLTLIEDDHSRAVCGYMSFLGAPSAMNTALALRQAIWPKAVAGWPVCGIPDRLYVDHGSDFTSHQLTQIGHDLHFEIIFSTIARPQGRGKIERLFGTINTELLPGLPGHLAPRQRHPVPALTLDQLDTAIGHFITDTYLPRIHSELRTSPVTAWVGDGWLPRLPASIEELNVLLLTVAKSRVVHRDGIHFQGLRYLSPTLAAYVGERVILRYDPRDITEIRVFHNDRFLCKAVDPEHSGTSITLKDIQTARAARRREVRSQINERIAAATEYLPGATPARHTTPSTAG